MAETAAEKAAREEREAREREENWTPDQPLIDEEDEAKAKAISRAKARTDYLYKTLTADPKKRKKKGFDPFASED
jgi:hypothetical protein